MHKIWITAAITGIALVAACKTTGKSPPDVDYDEGGDGGSDGADGADGEDGGDGGVDTDDPCWVDGAYGLCWDCELPDAPEDDSVKALNQCSSTPGVQFNNAERIPASTWTPGDDLPEVG